MTRDIPDSTKERLFAEQTSSAFLVFMTLSHSDWDEPQYIVNNTVNLTSNGQEYTAIPFTFVLPDDSDERDLKSSVVVSSITLDFNRLVREVSGKRERINVSFFIADSADLDTELLPSTNFIAVNVVADVEFITFDLAVNIFDTEPFPGDSFTPKNFPGLF